MTARRPWDRQRTLVLLALATGHSRAAASAKAGIADRTLRRWAADDDAFAEAIEVAMGEGRAVYEELLKAAGKKDWRAALAAYEVIYLGGTRRNSAEATATLMVTPPPPPPRELSPEEEGATFIQARDIVRALVGAVGVERATEVIARRDQRRRRIG